MAGLQRSEISFRRSGSSGLVWDDKVVSGELKKLETGVASGGNNKEDDLNREAKASSPYKVIRVDPAYDPPSPRASGCGACGGLFGKPASKSHKRKSAAAAANNRRK